MDENVMGQPAKSGLSRRTIVKGAAWSVPVIAVATASPLAAASVNCTVAVTAPTLAACGSAPLEIVIKDASGTQIAGQVSVTLPAGLKWGDGTTGTKTVVVTSTGVTGETIMGTGQGGTFTITAQGLAPCTATAAPTVVTVQPAGGRLYYLTGGRTVPVNADPTGAVPDPVQVYMDGGASSYHVLTADGSWWVMRDIRNDNLGSGTWTELTAPPMASLTASTVSGNMVFGLTPDGQVWEWFPVPTAPNRQPVLRTSPVAFTELVSSSNNIFGLTADGQLWYAPESQLTTPFRPVVIAGTNPQVPLTGITEMVGHDDKTNTSNANYVLANGILYKVTGATATPIVMTGVSNPTNLVSAGAENPFVLDDQGALWTTNSAVPQAMVRVTNPPVPAFESLWAVASWGAVGITADGRMVWFSGDPQTVPTQDWTPSQFSVSDIVEWEAWGGESYSTNALTVRLANGEVWTRSKESTDWTQVILPSGAIDIYGTEAGGGYKLAFLLDGNTTC